MTAFINYDHHHEIKINVPFPSPHNKWTNREYHHQIPIFHRSFFKKQKQKKFFCFCSPSPFSLLLLNTTDIPTRIILQIPIHTESKIPAICCYKPTPTHQHTTTTTVRSPFISPIWSYQTTAPYCSYYCS